MNKKEKIEFIKLKILNWLLGEQEIKDLIDNDGKIKNKVKDAKDNKKPDKHIKKPSK